MQQIIKTIDRRRAHIKSTINLGRAQMVRYFAARYSWGQACDPRRAYDWGIACAYLRHCQYEGIDPDYRAQWIWPSGNRGSVGGLIDVYHDGWELLHDLGLTDCDEFDPEPEEADPVAAAIVARSGVPADRLIVSHIGA